MPTPSATVASSGHRHANLILTPETASEAERPQIQTSQTYLGAEYPSTEKVNLFHYGRMISTQEGHSLRLHPYSTLNSTLMDPLKDPLIVS